MGKALGKKCVMIERHYMGGDCLNVGCFPSKVLIASAQRAHDARHAAELGVSVGEVTVDFPRVMERMRELRAQIAPVDSVERYKKDFCEDIFLGEAKFTGANTVTVAGGPHGDVTLNFDRAMIATGASPMVPPIPGLKECRHVRAPLHLPPAAAALPSSCSLSCLPSPRVHNLRCTVSRNHAEHASPPAV